jgi:hypothetical protein
MARLLRGTGQRHAEVVELLEENERWYRSAGGGDFALLTLCVLAAERDDDGALRPVLDEARAAGNLEVQVCALDALARLAAEATTARARAEFSPSRTASPLKSPTRSMRATASMRRLHAAPAGGAQRTVLSCLRGSAPLRSRSSLRPRAKRGTADAGLGSAHRLGDHGPMPR